MSTTSKTRYDVQVRWMIRRDMPEVLDIERSAFEFPWCEEDYLGCLRQRNCIGMIAENRKGQVIGAMIYELLKRELHVLNFVVHPLEQRSGVGRAMAEKVINKLCQQRRQVVTCEVRETNLGAQLFWKAMGFEATDVLRSHYEETDESAYRFEYVIRPEQIQQQSRRFDRR